MAIERWEIDSSHSGIHFSVRHMVISKVRGQFARWSATLLSEEGTLDGASVEVLIDAASIDTGVADRDTHLKAADFFDAVKYPELTFKGKRAEGATGDKFKVVGDLTIKGVTREVTLDVEFAGRAKDPWGNERAGFAARTSIERKEFGLTWNQVLETGGVLVSDRVDIEIELEAVKQKPAKAA